LEEDAHLWNFLLPKNENHEIKIVDGQSWRHGLGVEDLSYMMAMHWYPDRRKTYKISLLERYYGRLVDNGIRGYSSEDLIYDCSDLLDAITRS
jgi:hypothetical protein